jgi:PncC family amidohydrolase
MELSADVNQRIAAIAADDVNGASLLAREALQTMALCARTAPERNPDQVLDRLRLCARQLATAHPEMVSLQVWVWRLLRAVEATAAEGPPTSQLLGEPIAQRAEAMAAESSQAVGQVIRHAVDLLPGPSVGFTASYSQTVRDALRLAHREGKLRRALVTESKDAKGHSHGRLLAEALSADGIEAEVLADAGAPDRVGEADVVWIGADTVFADGSAFNGAPSLAVAEAAKRAARPLYVLCESAKLLSELVALGGPASQVPSDVPAGMDRVPLSLITAVITERGPSAGLLNSEPGGEASNLVARIAEVLVTHSETVAVLESGAGGRISDVLTNRPGSSAWYAGGAVAYSNASKEKLAGLTSEQLRELGAVSLGTAQALADGARQFFGASWGIGETGIAGPQTGRRSSKPAGRAYLAVSGPNQKRLAVEVTTGLDDRQANKQAFALAALQLLLRSFSA